MLLRNEPNPGREVTSRSEGPGVSNTRYQSGCQYRTDPGNVMKALARLVGPVPGHDHPIKLQDLLLEAKQLSAELGEVRSDRINHRGLLADEQMACAVKHQAALLLRCLGWHEPHVGSGDRLANRLCVSHVVLLPFDVRLHVSWRH